MNVKHLSLLTVLLISGCVAPQQHQSSRGLSAAKAASIAAITPPYTEEKNAASGFVGTQNFYIGRMAATCKPLLGAPESFPKDTVAKWQARAQNGTFFRAMVNYTSSLTSSVSDPVASFILLQSIQEQVQKNGQTAVDNQIKGSDEQKLAACKTFIANIDSGALDISNATPFYSTLEGIAKEFGSN